MGSKACFESNNSIDEDQIEYLQYFAGQLSRELALTFEEIPPSQKMSYAKPRWHTV